MALIIWICVEEAKETSSLIMRMYIINASPHLTEFATFLKVEFEKRLGKFPKAA